VLPYEQDSAHLARLLASADALVHAGVHETFGLIVIEAMACGRPVVAVRSGALTELVGDDVGVLAASSDPRTFADAIETLYAGNWQAMGRRAREKVEKLYTWKSTFSLQLERYAHLTRHESADGYADVANAQ
jgi:alpha-1,6-mannosyltransferase